MEPSSGGGYSDDGGGGGGGDGEGGGGEGSCCCVAFKTYYCVFEGGGASCAYWDAENSTVNITDDAIGCSASSIAAHLEEGQPEDAMPLDDYSLPDDENFVLFQYDPSPACSTCDPAYSFEPCCESVVDGFPEFPDKIYP